MRSATNHNVFRSQPDPKIRAALAANPVLRAALGGQVMMCRATMDPVWARYLSNIHFLLDDSKFHYRVCAGIWKRDDLTVNINSSRSRSRSTIQVGAILGGDSTMRH